MDDYNPLAGRQAEFIERIPPKAAIWDSLQTTLGQLEALKLREAETAFRLEQMTASYELLKAQYEDAMSMALEPEEGLTVVERKVLAAEPAVTDWRTV